LLRNRTMRSDANGQRHDGVSVGAGARRQCPGRV
jgi:hypothetical protein